MGYDGKYGRVTTEHGDIPDDEPVIVFRARDKFALAVLAHYLKQCDEGGSPLRHLELIVGAMATFLRWRRANQEKIKVPDSERSREWMS